MTESHQVYQILKDLWFWTPPPPRNIEVSYVYIKKNMFNYGIHSRTAFLNKIVWKWKCFLCDGMCNVEE